MRLARFLFILPIRVYQKFVSPVLGGNCRYLPTCSAYTIDAIEKFGVIKGLWLGARRIGSCHPWGGHGYQPVPEKFSWGKFYWYKGKTCCRKHDNT